MTAVWEHFGAPFCLLGGNANPAQSVSIVRMIETAFYLILQKVSIMTNQTALQTVLHTVFTDSKTHELKTNSRFVAEVFGKRHDDVLRSIRSLTCSDEFSLRNFAESTYLNSRGQHQPMVDMTFDGFTFLVMGFTGAAAAQFKEAYIGEFNRMRTQIAEQHQQEIEQLKKYVKLPILPLDAQREAQIIELLYECMPIADVARVCRVSQRTVRMVRDSCKPSEPTAEKLQQLDMLVDELQQKEQAQGSAL